MRAEGPLLLLWCAAAAAGVHGFTDLKGISNKPIISAKRSSRVTAGPEE